MAKIDLTKLPGFKSPIGGPGEDWSIHSGEEVQHFIENQLQQLTGLKIGFIRQYPGADGQVIIRCYPDAESADVYETDPAANADKCLATLSLAVASGGAQEGYTLSTRITQQAKPTIVKGSSNVLKFSYNSYYGGDPTDVDTEQGTLTVTINGTQIKALEMRLTSGQEYEVELGPHLTAETNSVILRVSNSHGNSRPFSMTLNTVEISLSFDASYDETIVRDAGWPLRVVCNGAQALLHLSIDGTETATASVSNATRDFTIDEQGTLSSGVHTVSIYAENAEFGIQTASITTRFIKRGSANPAICFGKETPASAALYDAATFPYFVYFPTATAGDSVSITGRILTQSGMVLLDTISQTVTFNANGESGITRLELALNDRRYLASSPVKIELTCGGAKATHTLTVTDPGINIDAAPQCKVYLSAAGRSNSDTDADNWQSVYNGEVTATVERSPNFRLNDEAGYVNGAFVHPAGRYSTINGAKPFAKDCGANAANVADRTGKTIEFEIETANCTNTSAKIVECMDGGVGFEIYADRVVLRTASGSVESAYVDETRIRIGFVIEGTTRHCINKTVDGQTELDANIAWIYINGVPTRIMSYGVASWKQPNPQDIVIGSDECDVKLYTVRIYDMPLTPAQMIGNYAFDTPNAEDKIAIATRNDVLNSFGEVDFTKTCKALPNTAYKIWEIPKMPTGKKDWQKVNTEFHNPLWSGSADDLIRASYVERNHDMALDGTSSLSYPDPYKNWANKHNGEWTVTLKDGTSITITVLSIAEGVTEGGKQDVDKVNFASSEGIFNILAANAYQKIMRGVSSSYPSILTPMQAQQVAETGDFSYRQSLAGFPEIGWLRTYTNGQPQIRFLSLYNYVNNKYDGTPYGIKPDMEGTTAQMWEVEDNVNFFMEELPEGEWKNGKWSDRLTTLYYARVPKDYGVAESEEQVAKANEEGKVMRAFHNYINACHPSVAERYRLKNGDYRQLDAPETFGSTTYTHDTPDYRRALFRNTCQQFLDLPNMCYYYLYFTGLLGVDSMDKNMTITLTK